MVVCRWRSHARFAAAMAVTGSLLLAGSPALSADAVVVDARTRSPDATSGVEHEAGPAARLHPDPAATLRITVRRFEFEGNTVFPEATLRDLVRDYEGRSIGTEDLLEARQRVTLFYLQRGYLNSGVVVPDQDLRDGIVRLRIVEGRLTRIDIRGTSRLDAQYVLDRVALDPDAAFNINTLQERLRLLQQNPLIRRLQGELRPGERPGESDLDLLVEEAPTMSASLTLANDQSPSIGSEHAYAELVQRNLTGRGDALRVGIGGSEGLRDGRIVYTLPLSASDALLRLGYEQSQSVVVEEPFDGLDIRSRTKSLTVGLILPVHKSVDEELDLGIAVEHRENRSSLLGVPFSFFDGAVDGVSIVSPVRLSLQHTRRRPNDALALRSTVSVGLEAFNATVNRTAPDGRFVAWLGQTQWARRLDERGDDLMLRAEIQLADRALLPLERFAMGGAAVVPEVAGAGGVGTVRGYRRNALVRDNAVAAGVEYLRTVWRMGADAGALALGAFADYGYGWNRGLPTPEPRYIASVGAGVRWFGTAVQAAVYWGFPLRNTEVVHRDLQDRGVHFALQFSWPPPTNTETLR